MWKNTLNTVAGSCFGIGFFPFAPGTVASAVILPVVWLVSEYGGWLPITLLFGILVLAALITGGPYERQHGPDPASFVLDEWAGQLLPFVLLALTAALAGTDRFSAHSTHWGFLGTGFVVFRFFDILKPLYIDRLQRYPGAAGILLDDMLAGFYTYLILILVILVIF